MKAIFRQGNDYGKLEMTACSIKGFFYIFFYLKHPL